VNIKNVLPTPFDQEHARTILKTKPGETNVRVLS
jgi:hypothetical protein